MQSNSSSWFFGLAALFLAACLVLGLWLGQLFVPKPVIGVLRFEGIIEFTSAQYLIEVMDKARQDESVAGVVVEILSPGGFATSSESIYFSMLQLRQEKPLVVYIDGLAASGGYYMAAAANRIYAPPAANIGNVGARGMHPSDPFLAPMEMSTGPYKLFGGSRFDRIHQLELVGGAFVESVAHQRQNAEVNPLKLDVNELAEARIYVGSEAAALGLIDFEGAHSDAVLGAAELAGVSEYDVVDLAKHVGVASPNQPQFAANSATGINPGAFVEQVQELVAQAPSETIYFLDSRIPLTAYDPASDVEAHLLALRAAEVNPVGAIPNQKLINKAVNQAANKAARPSLVDQQQSESIPSFLNNLISQGE